MTRGRAVPVILGPCRCRGCGALVVYATGFSRTDWRTSTAGACWREPGTRRVHRCAAELAA